MKNDLKQPLLLLLIFFSSNLFPQNYQIRNYTESDGLISSIVYDAHQDSLGRMWFATRAGVSVYDGYEWISYSHTSGLSYRPYKHIEIDEKGIVWALPEFGEEEVAYFIGDRWRTLPVSDIGESFLDCTAFNVAYWNDSLAVVLGTRYDGLYVYFNHQWQHYSEPDIPDARIRDILPWDDGFLVATRNGLFILDEGGVRSADHLNRKLPPGKLLVMRWEKFVDREGGRLWLLGDGWLGSLDGDEFTRLDIDFPFTFPGIYHLTLHYALQPTGEGLYLGWNSLYYYHFKSRTLRKIGQKNGMISNSADNLHLDREGNIWILTFRGISKLVSMRFSNYNKSHGLLDDEVSSIVEWRPGEYVFGHNSGLTFFDGQEFRTYRFDVPEGSHATYVRVLDMDVDRQGNLWVAASGLGLARFDSQLNVKWFKNGPIENSTRTVLVDDADGIWAVDDNAVYRVIDDRMVAHDQGAITKNNVRKLIQDGYGNLYLATSQNGVLVYRNGKFERLIPSGFQEVMDVFSIYALSQDSLLLGTMSGLFLWDGEVVSPYEIHDMHLKRPIFGMIRDRDGRLWIGTDNGMFVSDTDRLIPFQRAHGFVGKEINRDALVLDSKGNLLLGTDMGLTIYNRDLDPPGQKPAPIVKFLDLEVGGEKKSLEKPVYLHYNQNTWTCHFYGNSLINEDLIAFRLKLDGFDSQWIEDNQLVNRQIRYTNLPPGTFRFLLQAVNADGIWSPVLSSHTIHISKPYWRSIWFIVISVLVLTLSLYIVFKYISDKRYARTLAVLVKERTRQLEESEEKYRLVAENPIDGIVMLQFGMVFWVNRTFLTMFGYSENEVLNRGLEGMIEPEVNSPIDFSTMRIKQNGFSQNHFEIRGSHKSGRHLHVEVFTSDPFFYRNRPTVLSIFRDITEKKEADEKIKKSLEEKEILLKEVHHRVKNNLQIISSLLSLQSRQVENKDVLDMFLQSQNRVRSMALLHEKIYQSEDFANINFASYIRSLVNGLFRVYHLHPGDIVMDLDVSDVPLDIDQAVPCGLVINELLSNAMKHAFTESFEGKGEICVKLDALEDQWIQLVVSDNGVGLPDGFDISQSSSLGMKLVNILVNDQLHGELTYEEMNEPGFRSDSSQVSD